MIDTVSIALARPVEALLRPSGWTFSSCEHREGFGGGGAVLKVTTSAVHGPSGMRVWGYAGIFQRVEFSLPRMLANTNCNLLDSAEQMVEAVNRASETASALLGAPLTGKITRLDLCFQFRGVGTEWVAGFRNSKHPRIRKPNWEVRGETLYIKGSELEFCIYDKGLEAGVARDEIVRLECRLKTARLVEDCFGKELQLSDLTFGDCYR